MLDINVNNIFFKSYSVDPNTGHSIYVFDSTYLPSPEEVGDKQVFDLLIDELMDTLMAKLPSAPYSLVVFSSGFSNKKISWVYGIKMFSKLPQESRVFLQKTYIVHESFFIRTVYQVLSNAMSIKFLGSSSNSTDSSSNENTSASLIHVSDLTGLSHLIDITRLRISLNVYMHDYELSEYIDVPSEYFGRLTTLGNRQYRQLIFDKVFKRLQLEGINYPMVFQKPGSYKKVNILLDIIERSNYIDLSQWDIYSLASIFLHFLKNKSKPLIPIDFIALPIVDDFDYTYATFLRIIHYNEYYELLAAIFPLFTSFLDNEDHTKHNSKTLSKALTPTLCKEKISILSSDRLSIGTRYIKNLLEHFPSILNRIESSTRSPRPVSTIDSTKLKQRTISAPITSPVAKQPVRVASQGLPPPALPKPRKLSPTRSENRDTSPTRSISRSTSPIRTLPPLPDKKKPTENGNALSNIPVKLPPLNISNIPSLKPETSNNETRSEKTVRISSDSSSILADESLTDSVSNRREPGSPTAPSEAIKEMVQDKPANDDDNDEINNILKSASKLTLEHNEKILTFDKELKKKKKLEEINNTTNHSKFSDDGYSGIKSGSKVGRLAALYEERVQGIQMMNEMQKKMNNV
ncbi:hypothetical protein Kpol_2001p58 [Vanderwaltozyma polyspora DSM 70294]|uniref:Rho-GAP domain-containing protein n=1 Tax=Vanderwaltozyma polyspora (strain ATCC 22028 / DSM 70294 / BCRC 21397 / CBS 2163 / NBRC 10782 / NRRL Y-8283 / UCD 57-17) TaxID=436907 RepID=A7TGU0_VANPO|nr:uncharacterized protein Kpol_2001p58 [Vanderwaltozyma polyspora DSM 70294]EDO18553.1 hypothetical protein Kpol_2001p58 [Vanderwaltozyma polyspora DSM 70294]